VLNETMYAKLQPARLRKKNTAGGRLRQTYR
jgi:hypothetical protein